MQKNDNPPRSLAASPSGSPASRNTAPTTDSDWSPVASNWSAAASRQPSRTSTPALNTSLTTIPSTTTPPPPGDAKTLADFASWMKSEDAQQIFAQAHVHNNNWLLPSSRLPDDSASFDFTTPPRSRSKAHIPRPPNAFMLFRAEKVNAELPRDLPNRQQTVSVVAGQCWNMLTEQEKGEWHTRARDMLKKHMERYPDYKFSPARKSSRKKADAGEGEETGDWIRHLREKYLKMPGPSNPSSRARKSRSRKTRNAAPTEVPVLPQPCVNALPPMNSAVGPLPYDPSFGFGGFGHQVFSPYPQGQIPMHPSAPFMGPTQDIDFAALSSSYLQSVSGPSSRTTTPSPVPSSSSSSEGSATGGSTSGDEEVARPVDDDKTPTAATFGPIAIPRAPILPNISHYANSNHMLGLHELAPYASIFQPSNQTQVSLSSSVSRSSHQDSSAAYYSALFPPSSQHSSCTDASPPLDASSIPREVRETFGVKDTTTPSPS